MQSAKPLVILYYSLATGPHMPARILPLLKHQGQYMHAKSKVLAWSSGPKPLPYDKIWVLLCLFVIITPPLYPDITYNCIAFLRSRTAGTCLLSSENIKPWNWFRITGRYTNVAVPSHYHLSSHPHSRKHLNRVVINMTPPATQTLQRRNKKETNEFLLVPWIILTSNLNSTTKS